MSLKKLQWKDLSLDELELVLKTDKVTGEPEDYEYIRQDGKLRILSGESTVDVVINEIKAAWASTLAFGTSKTSWPAHPFADAWFKI